MKRALIAVFCISAMLLAEGAKLSAANFFGDITIMPEPGEFGRNVEHGYIEHRFHVANRSISRAHEVVLIMPNKSYSSGGTIRRVTRKVVVAPGTKVIVSLFQLPLEMSGDNLVRVLVDGRRKGTVPIPFASFDRGYHSSPADQLPKILMSRSIAGSYFENNITSNYFGNITSRVHSASTHGRYGGRSSSTINKLADMVRSEHEPLQWKENWLAYSSFDGLVLTESELKQMSQNTKLALLKYMECGGSLLVGGMIDIPRPWNKYPMQVPNGLKGYNVGFGQCIMSPTVPLHSLSKNQIRSVRDMWQRSQRPWQSLKEPAQANAMFPIVDKITLPVRALFILMTCFAAAIGLNIFILYRIKKQIWMLWTVPLLSGFTAVAVIAYAFISEGITPTIRIEGLTILDQFHHRATTLGISGYYCPLTPSSGLHFGFDSELTPLTDRQWRSKRNSPSKTIDLSRDQHLESGWISSRSPSFFMIRKSEMRRERLEIKQIDANSLSVVNGLGADIDKLWVTDKKGKVFTSAVPIPAGKKAALFVSGNDYKATNEIDRLGYLYAGSDWSVAGICPGNKPSALLISGTFIAFLNSAPFIEKGLLQRSREKMKSVVVGFWDEE